MFSMIFVIIYEASVLLPRSRPACLHNTQYAYIHIHTASRKHASYWQRAQVSLSSFVIIFLPLLQRIPLAQVQCVFLQYNFFQTYMCSLALFSLLTCFSFLRLPLPLHFHLLFLLSAHSLILNFYVWNIRGWCRRWIDTRLWWKNKKER